MKPPISSFLPTQERHKCVGCIRDAFPLYSIGGNLIGHRNEHGAISVVLEDGEFRLLTKPFPVLGNTLVQDPHLGENHFDIIVFAHLEFRARRLGIESEGLLLVGQIAQDVVLELPVEGDLLCPAVTKGPVGIGPVPPGTNSG